ncbi:hypothetical protein NQ176_g5065 [Zarea fungicola]|uniref:Uncharacterized protein n=1 Tax=Zarea fungicola TaxID=93591 RepID=A0ACC1NBS2_9HYPO|nr:hypothetical protein NQ176_g5065 [Lecanicillium fungicola]
MAASRPKRSSPVYRSDNDSLPVSPPAYTPSQGVNQPWYHDEQPARGAYTHMNTRLNSQSLPFNGFRPLILPQIAYGDGQPFLRGYSAELSRYNMSLESFVQVVDRINVAILPSPENQLFQKGANVAGFFLPGAAGIALSVGQVAVGLGAAAGYSSKVSSALSEANTNTFFPLGLELCIGTSADVDSIVGINTGLSRPSPGTMLPEERLEYYNGLVAPLSIILPPERQGGRQEPIALLGNQLSQRNNEKKVRKAEKKLQKGKTKQLDRLETGLKWLILRQARQS